MAEKKTSVGPFTFASQVRAEASKVTWTSRQETLAATVMVLIMSILMALFLFVGDQIIGWFVGLLTGITG